MFMDSLVNRSSGKEKIPEERAEKGNIWASSTWNRQEKMRMKAEAKTNSSL